VTLRFAEGAVAVFIEKLSTSKSGEQISGLNTGQKTTVSGLFSSENSLENRSASKLAKKLKQTCEGRLTELPC
jgi:hypothetical protein